MSYVADPHFSYFQEAYRQGIDSWSYLPVYEDVARDISFVPTESYVLDIGCGRGHGTMALAESGRRAVGIDYLPDLVRSANERACKQRIEQRVAYVCGDAYALPFVDESFDAVVDVQTFQHQDPRQWRRYCAEVWRVLRPGGSYMNVSLSKDTSLLLGHNPRSDENGHFEKHGLGYHFFSDREIVEHLEGMFLIVDESVRRYDSRTDPGEEIALLYTWGVKSGV